MGAFTKFDAKVGGDMEEPIGWPVGGECSGRNLGQDISCGAWGEGVNGQGDSLGQTPKKEGEVWQLQF